MSQMRAKQLIKEAGFRLVQEYPVVVRVYEDASGLAIREIHEETTGKLIQTTSCEDPDKVIIKDLPRNRNQPADRIELLENCKKCDGLQGFFRLRHYVEGQKRKGGRSD